MHYRPAGQVGGLARIDTVQLLFQNGLRLLELALLPVLNHPAKSNTEGNERYVSQGHKRELKLNEIHMPALILHYTCSKTSHLLQSFKHQL